MLPPSGALILTDDPEAILWVPPGGYAAWCGNSLQARRAGLEVRDSLFCATPDGPEVIWLCRRPLSESTVARQALATGTGGINIDGCRVLFHSDQANLRHEVELDLSALGRWPTNFLLVHHLSCQRDPQGAWTCCSECPSHQLGVQSGIRPGMSGGGVHRKDYGGGLFGGIDCPGTARGDTGTASRFFPQFKDAHEVQAWVVKLLTTPNHYVPVVTGELSEPQPASYPRNLAEYWAANP